MAGRRLRAYCQDSLQLPGMQVVWVPLSTNSTYHYEKIKVRGKAIWELSYKFVTTMECENPPKAKRYFQKMSTPYHHYIVFDFEALMVSINQQQTGHLAYISKHVPVCVTIHDSFNGEPRARTSSWVCVSEWGIGDWFQQWGSVTSTWLSGILSNKFRKMTTRRRRWKEVQRLYVPDNIQIQISRHQIFLAARDEPWQMVSGM